jgi:hypothetical protein
MPELTYRLEIDASLTGSPVLPALVWAEGIESPKLTESDVPPSERAEANAGNGM